RWLRVERAHHVAVELRQRADLRKLREWHIRTYAMIVEGGGVTIPARGKQREEAVPATRLLSYDTMGIRKASPRAVEPMIGVARHDRRIITCHLVNMSAGRIDELFSIGLRGPVHGRRPRLRTGDAVGRIRERGVCCR